jgi:hypothetical protein
MAQGVFLLKEVENEHADGETNDEAFSAAGAAG